MPSCCPRGHSQVFFAQTGEQTVPYISNASQGDLWINPTLKLIYAFVDCYWQQVSCCEAVAPVAPRSLGVRLEELEASALQDRAVVVQDEKIGFVSKTRQTLKNSQQLVQNGTVLVFDSGADFVVENTGFYTIQFQANATAETGLDLTVALKKNYNTELSRSRNSVNSGYTTVSLLWTGDLTRGDRLIITNELSGEAKLENSVWSIVQL